MCARRALLCRHVYDNHIFPEVVCRPPPPLSRPPPIEMVGPLSWVKEKICQGVNPSLKISLSEPQLVISRGSSLILVCPCICVHLSWMDKTSVLPRSQTGITVGADTLRGALQVAYGIIFFFCSDDEKMIYEITIEML